MFNIFNVSDIWQNLYISDPYTTLTMYQNVNFLGIVILIQAKSGFHYHMRLGTHEIMVLVVSEWTFPGNVHFDTTSDTLVSNGTFPGSFVFAGPAGTFCVTCGHLRGPSVSRLGLPARAKYVNVEYPSVQTMTSTRNGSAQVLSRVAAWYLCPTAFQACLPV